MSTCGAGIALYRQLELVQTDHAFLGQATVFQAEVHAITMACQAAKLLPDVRVTYFSDSQSAIQAIAKSSIHSQTVLKAVQALNALG
jgi:ribonuclease HI